MPELRHVRPIMKASDLFVRALEAEGVERIFGIPGEENLDLLDSLSRSSIKLILTRHEQAAGFMAATYGRLTGKAGVCLSTLGPGATNLVTAAAYAQLGGMPILMITGQKPIRHSKQGQFQIIDVVDMMQPLTKYTKQIVSPDSIPSRIREALRLAEEERPGATHLELPEDIAQEDTEVTPLPASLIRRPVAERKGIDRALEGLKRARHPILVIGAGANRKLTAKQLRAWVDCRQMPFITTQMGKGVIDETHPCFLGNAAVSDNDFVHQALKHADLILNVGHDVIEKPPFFMHTGERDVIHVNFNSAVVDPVYFPQSEIIGDIANTIWQLNGELDADDCHWDFSVFDPFRQAIQSHIEENSRDDHFPMDPRRLVRDVRQALPDDAIITLDNGVYKIWFARNYPARQPNTVLLDNALASMGAGLPSAIAAKMIEPERKVVALCGDGGFMMNSQELETAVRLKLDLVVVILNDSSYGMIKWKQDAMGFDDYGLDFANPCFVTYAKAYGARGHRVASTDEFLPLLKSCLDQGGVHLIDVPIDYSASNRMLNEHLPELSAALAAKS